MSRVIDGHCRYFNDRAALLSLAESDRCALRPQSVPLTARALGIADPLRVPAFCALGTRLEKAPHQARDRSLPEHVEGSLAGIILPFDGELAIAGAIEQDFSLAFRKPAPGPIHVHTHRFTNFRSIAGRPVALLRDVESPGFDRSLVDGQGVVGDDELGIDFHAGSQAVAVDTHPLRAVERKPLRREFWKGDSAVRASHLLREDAIRLSWR